MGQVADCAERRETPGSVHTEQLCSWEVLEADNEVRRRNLPARRGWGAAERLGNLAGD